MIPTLFRHMRVGSVLPVLIVSVSRTQLGLLLPPCGKDTHLQGSRMPVWLPPAGLFYKLAEELILKLRMGQTHLQGTLGQ